MNQNDIIQTALKDSSYNLSLFTPAEIETLRNRVVIKESKGRKTPFVTCIIRDKDVQLKPEEIVRQLYASKWPLGNAKVVTDEPQEARS